MNKTKIEWVRNLDGSQGYTINPIKGYCPHDCSYCYSHRMYNRFGWDRKLRFDESVFNGLKTIKKPSRIFVGSMIDMYHPAVIAWSPFAVHKIIIASEMFPQHTFITLTKFPENLNKFDFPTNWWIGVTVDRWDKGNIFYVNRPFKNLMFTSFEPLLTSMEYVPLYGNDWIIIGGLTPKPVHKTWWVEDIVNRADSLSIPVFIKKNANYPYTRKEFSV